MRLVVGPGTSRGCVSMHSRTPSLAMEPLSQVRRGCLAQPNRTVLSQPVLTNSIPRPRDRCSRGPSFGLFKARSLHDDYHVVHVLVVLTHGISAELEAFSEASKLAISRAGAKRLARHLLCQSTTPPYVSRTSTVTHLRSPQLQSRDPQAHHRGWCIT